MKKLVVLFLIIGAFLSCGEKKMKEVRAEDSMNLANLKKLPKKADPSQDALFVLKDWTEYNAMNSAINAIYSAESKDDLTVVVEDLLEKLQLLETSTYPDVFNRPDIKSRQQVFKTYLLKIKSKMAYDSSPNEAIVEMVKAYNAYTNQFSMVMGNTIDTDLLFNN